jgi:pyrroloquinoline quinone biosynthesis protein B
LGLLSLRESHPIVVFASESVRAGFTGGNVLYRTLERFSGQVTWRGLHLGREVKLDERLSVTAVAAPGKLPLHLEGLRVPSSEDSVGLLIREERTGRQVAYFSGVAGPTPELAAALADAEVVFFDGTFWSSDELIAAGLGTRRAEEMAHWPLGGQSGSLSFLRQLPGRKILIHVNNTNPILRKDSPERALVAEAGVEVAQDGMEIDLAPR